MAEPFTPNPSAIALGRDSTKLPRLWRMNLAWWLATGALLALAAVELHWQGRRWWCACGDFNPWVSDAWGPHNSQHLFDPYSFTHVLHGVLICGLLAWVAPCLVPAWRLWLALLVESLWEVIENSAFVIERYRAATAALGYEGDSVGNSLGDILSGGLGFVIAYHLGLRWSIVLFFAIELILLFWIRDNLFLNVLMLWHPVEAIKSWQMGR